MVSPRRDLLLIPHPPNMPIVSSSSWPDSVALTLRLLLLAGRGPLKTTLHKLKLGVLPKYGLLLEPPL